MLNLPAMSKSPNNRGFTIVEAMVAISILVIGLLAVNQLFPFSLRIIKDSENQALGANLVLSKLEEIQSDTYDSLSVGTMETKHRLSETPGNYLYSFQRETTVTYLDDQLQETESDEGMKKIVTTVYWYSPLELKEKSISISTLKSNY